MNTNTAIIPMEQDNKIISFELIVNNNKNKNKEVKFNKDGTVKKIVNNKVAGKDSEVYAFKTNEEIAAMITVFDKHIEEATTDTQKQICSRNKMLFLLGINLGIRASDLAELRWNYFFIKNNGKLEFKEFYVLQPMKQRKQKKFIKLFFNQTVKKAINDYLEDYYFDSLDEFIFLSRKGDGHIEPKTICKIVKEAAIEAGIKQNIGSHSLRKTWGFHCFRSADDKSKALVMLQQCFGHSSELVTMRYIGLLDEEISDMYNSINLGLELI